MWFAGYNREKQSFASIVTLLFVFSSFHHLSFHYHLHPLRYLSSPLLVIFTDYSFLFSPQITASYICYFKSFPSPTTTPDEGLSSTHHIFNFISEFPYCALGSIIFQIFRLLYLTSSTQNTQRILTGVIISQPNMVAIKILLLWQQPAMPILGILLYCLRFRL